MGIQPLGTLQGDTEKQREAQEGPTGIHYEGGGVGVAEEKVGVNLGKVEVPM